MTTIINSRIGENRGQLRVWMEGGKLARCGYAPDDKYNIAVAANKVILTRSSQGQFSITRRKERNGRYSPLIEITSARCSELKTLFAVNQLIRIVVTDKVITISEHHITALTADRENRLMSKLASDQPLDICSLFFGGGMLDRAAHDGFSSIGVKTQLSVIIEREAKYLDPALEMYSDMLTPDTYVIESPIQLTKLGGKKKVEIMTLGLPCTGASKAGKAKNKNKSAEEHPDAGAMFYYFLRCAEDMNPAIITLENVCEYANTEGMAVIRSVLTNWGYSLYETTVSGNEAGSIEDRKRLCVIAVSINLNLEAFNIRDVINGITLKDKPVQPLALTDIMDDVPLDSPLWKSFDYLALKAVKDSVAGKGFKRQLLTGAEKQCGTIGRGYFKCRSTEPYIIHPENAELSRLFTVNEHAKVKGFPTSYLNPAMSDTTAHEILGQGVIYPAFKAVFKALACFLLSLQAKSAFVPCQAA
ncbi:TPA: DNA cytosine methyltransferase [Yersinia enterocolitica]|nr:DNA cytosine methyltransferase [Yersinia enterocolitica]